MPNFSDFYFWPWPYMLWLWLQVWLSVSPVPTQQSVFFSTRTEVLAFAVSSLCPVYFCSPAIDRMDDGWNAFVIPNGESHCGNSHRQNWQSLCIHFLCLNAPYLQVSLSARCDNFLHNARFTCHTNFLVFVQCTTPEIVHCTIFKT